MNKKPDPGAVRLFLISFLILYLELVCIRWTAAYILYLGYFTNFILLGCFLGIGAGTLLANKPYRLIRWLPLVLFGYFASLLVVRAQVTPQYESIIYFTSDWASLNLPAYIVLPFIFVVITAIFTLLSQDLGSLLTRFAPLKAYSLNILGSLAGIAFFTLLSALSFPSWVWFIPIFLSLIFLLPGGKLKVWNVAFLFGLVILLAASDLMQNNIWSPYYRINLFWNDNWQRVPVQEGETTGPSGAKLTLSVNGTRHQEFTALDQSEKFYSLPFTVFSTKPVYQNVLVIGAGGGNDVAFALANGAEHVDAVEIDPRIASLGKQYHPEHPYDDPRVTVHVDDGRAFLEKTDRRYDLVVFALPDSVVLAATTSNLRLESYLFTEEAFQQVRNHLQPDGMFVLYNFYRYQWLIDKINFMLYQVFGQAPVVDRTSEPINSLQYATIFAGPKVKEIDLRQSGLIQADLTPYTPASDNWPFLYLDQPSLPGFYSITLLIILGFSAVYVWRLSPKGSLNWNSWPFFLMGAAFSLIEARSIVQFFLLYGSTWLVNSLVFFAVLLVVLVANWLAGHFQFKSLWVLCLLLVVALGLNILIPLKSLLPLPQTARYILATLLLFSPIFFANLIYSTLFRDTPQANTAFGANLLGTVVGGAVEYVSLLMGYSVLIFVAGIFYLLAFAWLWRTRRVKSSSA